MPIIRRLSLLALLISAAGLLVSCVPVPPYDPALAQQGAYVQQAVEPGPQPTASAPLPVQAEPAVTLPTPAQPEPPATTTASARTEPTSAPAALAGITPSATAVTVTIALAQPADVPVTAVPLPTETPIPTLTPTAVPQRAPTFTPQPASTVAPPPTRAPTKAPTATVDQHLIVITEDDIAGAIAAGAGAQQGLTVENLKVQFADGKTRITADRLGYGLIKMQNLALVGRLVAQNGVLSLEVESISPRGLAANFVPTAANQALANFGAQWYVEEVRTLDGQVELRVR